jgi:hypothetical protein
MVKKEIENKNVIEIILPTEDNQSNQSNLQSLLFILALYFSKVLVRILSTVRLFRKDGSWQQDYLGYLS